MVVWLIEQGADPNRAILEESDPGAKPLHVAAQNGHLPVVKELIKRGADINGRDFFGKTALDYAIKHKQRAVVKELKNTSAFRSF